MGVRVREKKQGSGEFWVFINHQGRRKSIKIGSESAANVAAETLEAQLKLDPDSVFQDKPRAVPTFKKLSENWLKEKSYHAKASTLELYEQIMKDYILPFANNKRVDEIKKGVIADAVRDARDKEKSLQTLRVLVTCFSGPLDMAVLEEHIPANPATGILKQMGISRKKDENGKGKRVKDEELFSNEEVSRFLATCQEHRPDYYEFFLFLFMTGCRLGETLALTWDDIEWDNGTVRINKGFRKELSSTKTGAERNVDIPPELVEALERLRTRRKREALENGTGIVPDIVFHRNGTHMAQRYARRVLHRILALAKLPPHRLHDCRHTYASLMIADDCNPNYLMRMLGHSSIQMTFDVYGHLMKDKDRDRTKVERLGKTILAGAPETHPNGK